MRLVFPNESELNQAPLPGNGSFQEGRRDILPGEQSPVLEFARSLAIEPQLRQAGYRSVRVGLLTCRAAPASRVDGDRLR